MSKGKNGGLLSNVTNISFEDALAVVSILGFTTIFINSIASVDIGPWVDGLLFMIIGAVLMLAGGFYSIVRYIENGLTNDEITKILTVLVGFVSFIVGLFTFPLTAFEGFRSIPVVGGIKTIISALAIIVIFTDTWVSRSLVK